MAKLSGGTNGPGPSWAILLVLFEKLMLVYDGEDQRDS